MFPAISPKKKNGPDCNIYFFENTLKKYIINDEIIILFLNYKYNFREPGFCLKKKVIETTLKKCEPNFIIQYYNSK